MAYAHEGGPTGYWTPDDVVAAHRAGEKILWRSCKMRTLEEVAIWADRHDSALLRKVRAATRRRDNDPRSGGPGWK